MASNEPLSAVKADAKTIHKLREMFYFEPNPSIRRVITIATPFRGSTFSNQTTQWLLDKLIHPERLLNSLQKVYLDNPGAFAGNSLLRVDTSIDSLAPAEPIFPVMLSSREAPWVTYHNIIGIVPKQWWLSKLAADGDGVVSRTSAHADDAVSEIIVPADQAPLLAHRLNAAGELRGIHQGRSLHPLP